MTKMDEWRREMNDHIESIADSIIEMYGLDKEWDEETMLDPIQVLDYDLASIRQRVIDKLKKK